MHTGIGRVDIVCRQVLCNHWCMQVANELLQKL